MNEILVKKFQLSNKSLEIIQCLFKFGSLHYKQLIDLIEEKSKQAIFKNINKLISKKIIYVSKYNYDNKKIYNLSILGKRVLGINKPEQTKTYLSIVEHNDKIIKFIKKLKLKNNEYYTETEIKNKFKDWKKFPDLMVLKNLNFSIQNQKQAITNKTALEFEFSIKTKKRYLEVFEKYNEMLNLNEFDIVIYFCNEKVFNFFKRFTKEYLVNPKIQFVIMPIKD